ncbi:Bug family tripartite tricarboxylate transporter substrate binding protein [Pigmentiphaga litoralis]|uniref:Tripartite-type tricarboxylate transporter receptor subunit TctC n=1 Tax=Pigmentiphaga litoralis TaxID=516702 RepID=A0A7Y9IRY9_9BURK|nr:tripartite tricarboxylate transporter substrate binding protein [Pigmentiphaga litoralis]NYE24492.1 tripartite-type tricarboxylate transporter receptor subunit TctC [Pigmentiphaga litoralis]NYE81894.1 tripartite-type tricarboxylate transporter receptor subunit TctC [Pigmentiphaga litoralis]
MKSPVIALLTMSACLTSTALYAQQPAPAAWPTQPIRLIVSQSAGGSIDIAARLIGQKLSNAIGAAVVVDNKAGANGLIAGEAAARATDGHTFLMTSPSTLTINQHVYKSMPYDTARDFRPVTQTTSIAFLLVVNANSPYKTLGDLIGAAKAKPGSIRFASAGIGNQSQLAAELLAGAAKAEMQHVPYKGEAPAIVDLIGGRVDFIFGTMPALLPQVQSGKLRTLVVGQPTRSAAVPDVPTTAEAGLPSVVVTGWTGIVAPASVPAPAIQRMHDEVVKILAQPDVRETLVKAGAEPVGSTPAQFGEFIRTETVKWGAAVKQAGITPE